MYVYIGVHITHLWGDHKDRIVYIPANQLPDVCFAIEHHNIPFVSIYDRYDNLFFYFLHDDSSDTEANGGNAHIDPEQSPVRMHHNDTPHFANRQARKPIRNVYFKIGNKDIDLYSPYSHEEMYWIAHWCVKHNLSRAAIDPLFRNHTMANVSNLTFAQTLFKRVNIMLHAVDIDSRKSRKEGINCLANPNILQVNDCTCFFITILLSSLSSSCNILYSQNICHMLQQLNSMMLTNLSTQRLNNTTGGGMNRYLSRIAS